MGDEASQVGCDDLGGIVCVGQKPSSTLSIENEYRAAVIHSIVPIAIGRLETVSHAVASREL